MRQLSTLTNKRCLNPESWQSIESAPKDGTLIDLRFDIDGAESSAAEFYAPGCTKNPHIEPMIPNVAYMNGGFMPVTSAFAAKVAASVGGAFANPPFGMLHGVLSVTPNSWRPAADPPQESHEDLIEEVHFILTLRDQATKAPYRCHGADGVQAHVNHDAGKVLDAEGADVAELRAGDAPQRHRDALFFTQIHRMADLLAVLVPEGDPKLRILR